MNENRCYECCQHKTNISKFGTMRENSVQKWSVTGKMVRFLFNTFKNNRECAN